MIRTHTLSTRATFNHLDESIYTKLYADIIEFRHCFGLPSNQLDLSPEDHALHRDLFCEEMVELSTAVGRDDHIDAIVDSVYVYVGIMAHEGLEWGHIAGSTPLILLPIEALLASAAAMDFNFLDAWDIVHRSNLSKLCDTDNVDRTVEHYKKQGVLAYSEKVILEIDGPTRFRVKVKKHCKDWHGKFYPAGKVLKSIGYQPADLTAL
jgi:hypothetical protein